MKSKTTNPPHANLHPYLRITIRGLLLATLFFSLSGGAIGCAFQKRKFSQVSVAGRVVTSKGHPISNKHVEVLLPAGYGLEDKDIDNMELGKFNHKNQRVITKTDALGAFNISFQPVSFPVEYWIIPPTGTTPDRAPYPFFYVRLKESEKHEPEEYYSVLFTGEKKTATLVHQSDGVVPLKRSAKKPIKVYGRLLENPRDGIYGWIADVTFRYMPKTRARLQRKKRRSSGVTQRTILP